MADEYIRRSDALTGVELFQCGWAEIEAVQTDYIERLPAADVAPVVHGKWIWADDGYCRCSECRQRAPVVYGVLIEDYQDEPRTTMTDFCPNCGAKMDGGDEGEH